MGFTLGDNYPVLKQNHTEDSPNVELYTSFDGNKILTAANVEIDAKIFTIIW